MNIKKKAIIVVLTAGMAFAGYQQAFARGGWGTGPGNAGYGQGMNYGCPGYGRAVQTVDAETQKKMEAFFADTQDLRKQIAMKQAEKMALMQAATPDAAKVAKVEGELFDLRASMQSKATKAGVPPMMGMGGRFDGRGQRGPGGMMFPCMAPPQAPASMPAPDAAN